MIIEEAIYSLLIGKLTRVNNRLDYSLQSRINHKDDDSVTRANVKYAARDERQVRSTQT